jgi:hypothetical protein
VSRNRRSADIDRIFKAAARAGVDVRVEVRADAIVATTIGKAGSAEDDMDRELAEFEARRDNGTQRPAAGTADRHLPQTALSKQRDP